MAPKVIPLDCRNLVAKWVRLVVEDYRWAESADSYCPSVAGLSCFRCQEDKRHCPRALQDTEKVESTYHGLDTQGNQGQALR